MEKLIGEYSIVEIPSNAINIRIDDSGYLLMTIPDSDFASEYYPDDWIPGNYELIGISTHITEQQAAQIVEKEPAAWIGMVYKNYTNRIHFCTAAKESFQSLLTSKGLKGRYAVIKNL